ncbi:IS1182 family transposase [Colwellia psychrerythraea]|uniref:IS1182 family transposase n=1 Tax=Colwellia psychrerythraea TaxID=28229 RepID=A0A1Y5EL01_COLPS|nr:IS1182 family transposase [Colwellia psychrerythraea]
MSRHIKGLSRSQATLFPEMLEDFISKENPVRVIDVFVDGLDLEHLGFKGVQSKPTGRPDCHPAILLKIYIYSYLNRIQSSRCLERETQRNVELMWLTERLSPDFKTIADFRKDNRLGIKNTCNTFVQMCHKLKMFNDATVAIDGSKFRASNNKDNNYTPSKVKFHIDRVEKNINNYLQQLEHSDSQENSLSDIANIEAKLHLLKQHLVDLKDMALAVNNHPDKQISTTDPDCRLMKTQGMTRAVCYKIQSSVDTKHHLIVAHEVTNTTDRGQLCNMTKQTLEALGQSVTTVLADKGYYSRQDIKDTQDLGVMTLVPKTDTSGSEKKGIFNKSLFKYNRDIDVYICPAGNELQHRFNAIETGLDIKIYFNGMACKNCTTQSQCTRSKKDPRRMRRWVHEADMEKMKALLKATPDAMLQRKQTVEHPFGTIKLWAGASHLLTRGLKNVSTELNLHVLAYNLKRMLSIFGTEKLMQELMVA